MTANSTLLHACLELVLDPAWWYFRLVEFYTDVFWLAGGGDLILTTIETVCLGCGTPPRAESLSRQLAALYPSPYEQYQLTVSLSATALWLHGSGFQLLDALRALTTSEGSR